MKLLPCVRVTNLCQQVISRRNVLRASQPGSPPKGPKAPSRHPQTGHLHLLAQGLPTDRPRRSHMVTCMGRASRRCGRCSRRRNLIYLLHVRTADLHFPVIIGENDPVRLALGCGVLRHRDHASAIRSMKYYLSRGPADRFRNRIMSATYRGSRTRRDKDLDPMWGVFKLPGGPSHRYHAEGFALTYSGQAHLLSRNFQIGADMCPAGRAAA